MYVAFALEAHHSEMCAALVGQPVRTVTRGVAAPLGRASMGMGVGVVSKRCQLAAAGRRGGAGVGGDGLLRAR